MMYDILLKWRKGFQCVLGTIKLRLLFYRNIRFSGIQRIHHSVQIYGRKRGSVMLGKQVSALRGCILVAVGGELKLGDHCHFSENCSVVCHESITIGTHCLFGPNVMVYDHDHRFGTKGVLDGYKTSPITIGDNCWIGANAVILRATHIGEGCVIGAGTVVKGDIPPHSLVTSDRKLIVEPIRERKE